MSELRDSFDGTTVSARVSQPPFAELASRGRRRSHRARAVRLAGVAVIAALAVIPLLTLPEGGGARTPAFPFPSASPPGEGRMGTSVSSLSFLDLDHGVVNFAIGELSDPQRCARLLSVTGDGGATWSEFREVPNLPDAPDEAGGCDLDEVIQPAAGTLIIPIGADLVAAFRQAGEDPPATSFISHDAGQTWQVYEPRVRTAEAVPDGVVPMVDCVAGSGGAGVDECRQRVYWYDPHTGDQMVAEHTPPALADEMTRHGEVTVAADGSIWVTGLEPDGTLHVSVSRDQGRSWLDRSPGQAGPDDYPNYDTATYDGDTGYFYWTRQQPDDPPGPTHLLRTTDGGETWQPLAGGTPFPGRLQGLWATRDGLIVVDEAGTTHLLDDGGDTFEDVDLGLPVAGVRPIRGGFHGGHLTDYRSAPGLDGALSPDGLVWRGYRVPQPPLPTQ